MARIGRKENGGFGQLACQSGHSRPRRLMQHSTQISRWTAHRPIPEADVQRRMTPAASRPPRRLCGAPRVLRTDTRATAPGDRNGWTPVRPLLADCRPADTALAGKPNQLKLDNHATVSMRPKCVTPISLSVSAFACMASDMSASVTSPIQPIRNVLAQRARRPGKMMKPRFFMPSNNA
jgi:hypothetical protein